MASRGLILSGLMPGGIMKLLPSMYFPFARPIKIGLHFRLDFIFKSGIAAWCIGSGYLNVFSLIFLGACQELFTKVMEILANFTFNFNFFQPDCSVSSPYWYTWLGLLGCTWRMLHTTNHSCKSPPSCADNLTESFLSGLLLPPMP